jgi:PhoH-like ATPase
MPRKTFVIDTSAIIHDPSCWTRFKQSNVVIPITVLDELDKIKSFINENGRKARMATRALDKLSMEGELHKGITIDNDITIKIDTHGYTPMGTDPTYGDSKILGCAVGLKEKTKHVVLISRDINLRIRAKALGIEAENYEKDKVSEEDFYMGHRTIEHEEIGQVLQDCGVVVISSYPDILGDLCLNECVLFVDRNGKGLAPGRRVGGQIKLVRDIKPFGLSLRNCEQLFLADLLMDPSIPLITCNGKAGTGKTLVALAAGLAMVIEKRQYDSLNIYRPISPLGGNDTVGFLPGSLEEKLDPWFAPIDLSFAFLFSDNTRNKEAWRMKLHQYITNGTINKKSIDHLRGQSLPYTFMMIDEAQNTSIEQIRTIVTRVGVNSKIILNGDIDQIDSHHMDATNNGLTHVVEHFKNSHLAGHISLIHGERSELATAASEIL